MQVTFQKMQTVSNVDVALAKISEMTWYDPLELYLTVAEASVV